MTDDRPAIINEFIDSIAILRFNSPATRNPLSSKTLFELRTLLEAIAPRPDIKAIILTGSEEVFASGADIRELAQLDTRAAVAFSQFGQRLFQSLAETRQVTIAAVNGYCMGGALDLALACDIRMASANAVFAHPGARLGIITGWGGTQRLPRIIGRTRAMELFLTARRMNAQEALAAGLVTSLHDPVLDHAITVIRKVLSADFENAIHRLRRLHR